MAARASGEDEWRDVVREGDRWRRVRGDADRGARHRGPKDSERPHRSQTIRDWAVFNLFNRVNFDTPNRTAFTANFGRVFSAQPARQMQGGITLTF